MQKNKTLTLLGFASKALKLEYGMLKSIEALKLILKRSLSDE